MTTTRKILFASLAYGLFVHLILPAEVVAVNDDFGYLRSVIATLQHGRPWTDAWLEPWAASFSSLAALLYTVTGHFHFATYGLLALLAATSFAATTLLSLNRQFSLRSALGFSTVLLTFPTFFWKEIEFTSLALYLPCLLFALWAVEKKRWLVFLVVWLLALASRQSALVWGVAPCLLFLRDLFLRAEKKDRVKWFTPVLMLLAGGGAFFLLSRGMNVTHSQTLLTRPVFASIDATGALRSASIGGVVFLIAAGLGAFFRQVRAPFTSWRRPIVIVAIALLALPLLFTDPHTWLWFEHEGFNGVSGLWYFRLMIVLAAVGWMSAGTRLQFMPAAWALACLAPVCLRPQLWDYYLIEVAVLGFFAATQTAASAPAGSRQRDWRQLAWFMPLVLCLFLHLGFALSLKAWLDRSRLLNETAELALRAGTLRPDELNFLPFGSIGWRWHPYFTRHEGRTSQDIAGFQGYIKPGAVDVGYGFSQPLHLWPQFRHVPPADRSRLIVSGEGRFLWVFKAGAYFLRAEEERTGTASLAFPANPPHESFPLNNQEWRALISSPPSSQP